MNRWRRFAVNTPLFLTAALVACEFKTTAGERIVVPMQGDKETTIALAEEIGTHVWNSGLKENILEQMPHLTEEDLLGLSLTWKIVTYTPITGEDRNPTETVRIDCYVRLPGTSEDARKIAKICGNLVRAEINGRIEPGA
jgi:hypothetical protein